MPIALYYQGLVADIFVYANPRGRCLAADFIDYLSDSDQAKVTRLIKEFGDRGKIWNREKFRLEDKPIYALKSYQLRLLCFYLPDMPKPTLVLTHGFQKKKDDMPPSELRKAKEIHKEITSKA
jgi:hypothetical protein